MNDTAEKRWNDRAYTRVDCNVPTVFWCPKDHQYFDLNIRNISQGGLYLESARHLQPNTNIEIFIGENAFGPELLEEVKHYKAQIKWIDRSQPDKGFKMGARILSKSNSIEENHLRKLLHACDLCGQYRFYKKLCEADECILLCRSCFVIFPELPEGIKKYLRGNIY